MSGPPNRDRAPSELHPSGGDRSPARLPSRRLPVSFSQQSFWLFHQLEPQSPVDNIPFGVRLRGPLDTAALEQSIDDVRQRHELLQVSFATDEQGHLIQHVDADRRIPLRTIDLSRRRLADPEEEAHRLARDECRTPFDLQQGPLLRATLLRLSDADHILLRTIHHSVADAWSLAIFRREMSAFYNARVRNEPLPPLPLPISFSDLVTTERDNFQGERLKALTAYWQRQLGGELPILTLPADQSPPARRAHAGSRVHVKLPPELVTSLRRLGGDHQATLFMTLLAALYALLVRYTRQDDLLVASPVAGRTRPETRDVMGPLVNTLMLRADAGGDPSFVELLARVRRISVEAFAHQEIPFDQILEVLPPAVHARPSRFQVMFVFEPPCGDDDLHRLTQTPLDLHTGTARCDLTLRLRESGDGLSGYLEYSSELLAPESAQQLAEHYRRLLLSAVADPACRLSRLTLTDEASARHIRADQDTSSSRPVPDQCVHQLFERQVRRTPEMLAVTCGQEQISYAELNRRSNRLAHYLRAIGAGPGTLAGVHLDRSIDLLVSLLAVLKAGGAYLPIDPEHPSRRSQFFLEDSRASLLVTQSHLRGTLSPGAAQVVCVDQVARQMDQGAGGKNIEAAVTAEDLAYVIYTSGSTGKPKGVQIPHRALSNLLQSMRRSPGLSGDDVLLAVTTVSFDIAALELFLPLVVGAQLVLAERDACRDVWRLAAEAERTGTTVMQTTPSRWRLLLEAGAIPAGLKVLSGGEPLSRELADQLLSQSRSVWNLYGPTETTIWSTCGEVERTGSVSIGQPIDNTQVYVLDRHRQPVPHGAVGELYIGGAGVARGYLKRPKLTSERFLPDPFSDRRGAIVFRTGDLARVRSDGALELLGRLDHQWKIRGVRVDAAEVETTLCAHDDVGQAAVAASTSDSGEKRLVAYVVRRSTGETTSGPTRPSPGFPREVRKARGEAEEGSAAELCHFLRQSLPEAMIPSTFVFLPKLPLTPNGKIDRDALAHATPEPSGRREGPPPRTSTEQRLAAIWAELLDTNGILRDDQFLHLGGHSLLAMRLAARVRATFGVSLEIRTFFEAVTLWQQAARIDDALQPSVQTELQPQRQPQPQTRGRGSAGRHCAANGRRLTGGAVPLSTAQQRLWLQEQMEPGLPVYHIPWSLRLRGPLQAELVEASLNESIKRHEALRTSICRVDGRPRQRIRDHLVVPVPVVDLCQLSAAEREQEVQRSMVAEYRRPFDLEQGPLIRGRLLRLQPRDHVLLVTIHHLVADELSLAVLQQEFSEVYSALCSSRPGVLEPLSQQYADWTLGQRERPEVERREAALRYWKEQLAGAPARLNLPTDFARPLVRSRKGDACTLLLPEGLTAALHDLAHRRQASLFMTLLATLQLLLARLSGQSDVVVGAPFAGRCEETERLIGLFVNMLPLRVDLSDNPQFEQLLDRVRETVLNAFTHEELPFEQLVEELRPDRRATGNPLFQVLLNVLNDADDMLPLPGIDARPLPPAEVYAKFDLTLYARVRSRSLRLALVFDTDLFCRARASEILRQFSQVLRRVAENPQLRVNDVPLLSEAAAKRLPNPCQPLSSKPVVAVHDLFRQQTRSHAGRTATCDAGGSSTYAELDRWSDCLARELNRNGVGAGGIVAVYGERSAALVWALLGTLKAGAAFSVLDPQYPAARLRRYLSTIDPHGFIRITTGSQAAVTAGPQIGEAACRYRLSVSSNLAAIAERFSGDTADAPPPVVGADVPAWVAFTSGTLGAPTAIVASHRPLSHFVGWQAAHFGLTKDDRFCLLSGLSHDPALRDIFTPLSIGATLCIPAAGDLVADRLRDWLFRERVTVAHMTPAIAELVTEGDPNSTLPALRYLFFGGDTLSRSTVERVRRLAPRARIVNFYGTTETPQAAASYTVSNAPCSCPPPARDQIPVGCGIPNTQLLVINASGSLAGIGEVGEIHVRSPHLARGYFHNEARTRARFVSNPWTKDDQDRLYKTGDLGRYLPSGDVEFLSRVDDQINLRGVRMDPGEVSAALRRHPAVRDSFVAAVPMDGSATHLTAWIVTSEADRGLLQVLRGRLLEELPVSMVPTRFVIVERLPLTPNGKVDRQALLDSCGHADTSSALIQGAHRFTPAPGTTGERIVEIWKSVLRVENIAPHDTFVDLGGYSLLAMQVIAKLEKQLGVLVAPQELLFQPISQLVSTCDQRAERQIPSRGGGGVAGRFQHFLRTLWFRIRRSSGTTTIPPHPTIRRSGPRPATIDPPYDSQ